MDKDGREPVGGQYDDERINRPRSSIRRELALQISIRVSHVAYARFTSKPFDVVLDHLLAIVMFAIAFIALFKPRSRTFWLAK